MVESSAGKYKAQFESLTEEGRREMQILLYNLTELAAFFQRSQAGVTHYRSCSLRLQAFEKLIGWGYLEEWNISSKKTLYHKKDEKGLDGFRKFLVSYSQ